MARWALNVSAVLAAHTCSHQGSMLAAVGLPPSDEAFPAPAWKRLVTAETRRQAVLLRDIVGDPFRPVVVDPTWLTSTVVAIAEGVYANRAFDRLPILADSLEEAGCEHADVLVHCRSAGPHVRGCWVVDSVLGKT